MEWISVKDRLPENEQEVLVISHGWGGRLLYVGTYKKIESEKSWLTGITSKASDWSLWGWSYLREPQVTHWMPLPELPEGNRLLDKLPECLFTVRRNERGATCHLTKTGLEWLGRQLKIKITER